jgi:hypothetical protein
MTRGLSVLAAHPAHEPYNLESTPEQDVGGGKIPKKNVDYILTNPWYPVRPKPLKAEQYSSKTLRVLSTYLKLNSHGSVDKGILKLLAIESVLPGYL